MALCKQPHSSAPPIPVNSEEKVPVLKKKLNRHRTGRGDAKQMSFRCEGPPYCTVCCCKLAGMYSRSLFARINIDTAARWNRSASTYILYYLLFVSLLPTKYPPSTKAWHAENYHTNGRLCRNCDCEARKLNLVRIFAATTAKTGNCAA